MDDILKLFNTAGNWDVKGVVLTENGDYFGDRIQTSLFDYTVSLKLSDPCLLVGSSPAYFQINPILKQEIFVLEQNEWNILQLRCIQNKCSNCSKVIVNRFSSCFGKLFELIGMRTFICNGETTSLIRSKNRYTIDFSRFIDGYITFIIDKPFWFTPRFSIMMNKFTCNNQQFSHMLKLHVKNPTYGTEQYFFNKYTKNEKTTIEIYEKFSHKPNNDNMTATIRKNTIEIENFRKAVQNAILVINKKTSISAVRFGCIYKQELEILKATFLNIPSILFPVIPPDKLSNATFNTQDLELALHSRNSGKIKIGTMNGIFNWLHKHDPMTDLWTYNPAHGNGSSADASLEANFLYVFSDNKGLEKQDQDSNEIKLKVFVYEGN